MKRTILPRQLPWIASLIGGSLLLLALLLANGQTAVAQESDPTPFHPVFPLLDSDGENVLSSGMPVSTMETCGACHDADFITSHSFHADVGLSQFGQPGSVENGRSWDSSPGLFGKWNPLTYRYLSSSGDEIWDMTVPEWVMFFGARHVGGGPAQQTASGEPLVDVPPDANNPQTSLIDPETGERMAWDWSESGVVEMNCFLCHMANPDNEARVAALHEGQFGWANSATLAGTGIVAVTETGYTWNETAFDGDGNLLPQFLGVQDPTNANCGQCHGLVHIDVQTPLALEGCQLDQWSTITTGQIVSPQKLVVSGMNLADKNSLSRSWDVHAERVLGCTDCHYSLNNPIYFQEQDDSKPDHLLFDPRRIDFSEYLERPLHQFAKGDSAQGTLAPELDDTLRRCESCHSIAATHDWLPYKEQHTDVLSCETCHIPRLYAPAREYNDWTVLNIDSTPESDCRGLAGDADVYTTNTLVEGYEPVLLPQQNGDGATTLAPYNLITSWYWVYGDPVRPVPLRHLEAVWLDGDNYQAEVLALFDADGNGRLDDGELLIDNDEKEALIAGRLVAQGLDNPRIQGEVQPYSINHDVAHGDWVTQKCNACHGEASRITQPMKLADRMPGGVEPEFISSGSAKMTGVLHQSETGELYYQPQTESDEETNVATLYIFGHNAVDWIDWAGIIMFLGVLAGVFTHGGLRFWMMRQQPKPQAVQLQEVYMYSMYERLWHWLQTAVILILIFTGLVIHKPDKFIVFSFVYMVQVHNIMAALLTINAFLAAFYHLASGEIKQFIPQPRGFFNDAIEQTMFYLRGIFRGDPHPFEKTPRRKLNPLQQVTYFGLLNVLLPLQVITGALMWGVQRWPDLAQMLGGLPFLAPFHTLVAWSLSTFVVMHVYLTTTGHEPLAGIKGMVMGWDEVEVHQPSPQAGD